MSEHPIAPHGGGDLKELLAGEERKDELREASVEWPEWDLTDRQLCDLELLLNGGFSPLEGFMTRADYQGVCDDMHLADGTLWPMPITLDVTRELADELEPGSSILALRDQEGVMVAALHVEDVWVPDRAEEAQKVFDTVHPNHAGAAYAQDQANPVYVGGRLEGLELPTHYDFKHLRRTPRELRAEFARQGWRKVVGFQTRNPMHRAHFEVSLRAAKDVGANLLIHPVVGMTKPGDVDHFTRVRCYQELLDHYPRFTAKLSLLNLAMRMGGPREALWHAIIRKNHGCSHFIVGRDHAGPGDDDNGDPFYGPYEAQDLMKEHKDELGVEMVDFQWMVYVPDRDTYMPIDDVPDDLETKSISGTELRSRLNEGREIPEWFTFPEVATELRRTHPPRKEQGFTVFFTGLSGSGKSTLANVLRIKLLELGGRPVSLLDGDLVRKHLSSNLGFSKEDRDTNIRRIGWVAGQVTKGGGVAICAPIAPYDETRKEIREDISGKGGFILVHVATPLEVCEERDRKGLYAKARAGIVENFTGISDPYEEPDDAEVVVDTTDLSPDESAQKVYLYLEKEGFIGAQ